MLKSYQWVGWQELWGGARGCGVRAQEYGTLVILVSASGPFGLGLGLSVWGLRVWGQGLTKVGKR